MKTNDLGQPSYETVTNIFCDPCNAIMCAGCPINEGINNNVISKSVLRRLAIQKEESRPTPLAPDVCPDCKGKGIVKDGFGQLFECARCQGSGQRR